MARKPKKRKKTTSTSQTSQNEPRLSICMIVKNEEECLPECLVSIQGLADELIIVDTGSVDQTIQIAERHGAKVFHFEWVDDFSAARNVSLREATGDWILWVDADDRIDRRHHRAIRQLMQQPRDRAFAFVLENVGGDGSTCIQVRMFPNVPGVRFSMPVHEQVTPSLLKLGITKIAQTDVIVTHTGYTDPETIRRKKERYLEIMERWLVKHPDDYITRSHVALTYHTTGRPDEAIREYNQVVANPSCQADNVYLYRYALLFLARSHMQIADHHTAMGTLERAQLAGLEPTLIHLSLGECYHHLNQPEQAVAHLSYVQHHPMSRTYFPMDLKTIHCASFLLLGRNLERLNRTDQAVEAYEQAIQHNPENAEAWLGLAKIHETQEAWDQVERILVRATQHGLQSADIFHLLGIAALQRGQLMKAESNFQQALGLQPDHQGAGNNLGLTLQFMGKMEEAKKVYQTVLENHPGNMDTLVNLAHLHLSTREFEQARRAFRTMLAADMIELDILLGLAWASAELNRSDQVFLAYRELSLGDDRWGLDQQIDPGLPETPDHVAHGLLQVANRLWEQARRKLAFYAVQASLALVPSPDAWELVGDMHCSSESPRRAVESYERALLAGSLHTKRIFAKLGQCYTALGATEAARLCQEQAA